MRLVLLCCLLLSACGQAGDLYLPGDPSAAPAPPAAPVTEKKKDAH
jgi:predicted small lipoprotein YifL